MPSCFPEHVWTISKRLTRQGLSQEYRRVLLMVMMEHLSESEGAWTLQKVVGPAEYEASKVATRRQSPVSFAPWSFRSEGHGELRKSDVREARTGALFFGLGAPWSALSRRENSRWRKNGESQATGGTVGTSRCGFQVESGSFRILGRQLSAVYRFCRVPGGGAKHESRQLLPTEPVCHLDSDSAGH